MKVGDLVQVRLGDTTYLCIIRGRDDLGYFALHFPTGTIRYIYYKHVKMVKNESR